MKKKLLSMSMLLLTCSVLPTYAQVSLVNPVPQKVEHVANQKLIDAPASWNVIEGKSCTLTTKVALSRFGIKVDEQSSFKLTLGVVGDKVVKKVKKYVPKKTEGYYLSITPHEVIVAGADDQGLFYGVQTLLGIMSKGQLECCTITDWPDVPYRGTVEGFYGTPWSHEARISQLEFYGKNKMNVYIYGPKDDPWHRDKWRIPYPDEEAKRIAELVKVAHDNGVNFYWAIHPGVDIKWTTEDRNALIEKFERMYQIGVRSFAVFFDDIWGEGTDPHKQAELLNYVDNNFIKQKPDVSPLVMCPTEYNRAWANDEKGYLRTLGTQMNQGIEIMWTGNSVVHCIDKESMEWINQRINRKAYIWLNFPVSDFVRDHILLGPTYGNGLDIANDLSGFVSNPMEHAEASKIALYGIADYTWNMKAYDYNKDWERAIQELLPGNHEALRTFALYNKDLGPNGHGFRREEGEELKPFAKQALEGDIQGVSKLQEASVQLREAANILLGDNSNPRLTKELTPWLLQGKLLGEYGEVVCKIASTKDANQNQFESMYKQAVSLQKQMFDIENSSIRHAHQPGIKVGSKVMLPTLNQLFVKTVEQFNWRMKTSYLAVGEYNPYKLSSTVTQLAQLPIKLNGNELSITPALEVINWQAGGQLMIEGEQAIVYQGLDFNLGVPGVAKHFLLELWTGNEWKTISLLHYSENDPVVHTGNELSGVKATKLRLTNISGKEQKVYFKRFSIVKK